MAMRYGRSLYHSNQVYKVYPFSNRDEWLKGRADLQGIGGSDASAAIGLNPWRSNVDLWEIKTGRKTAPDISDNERVRYGQNAEQYIRRLYQLKHEHDLEVQYIPDVILQNNEHPEMLYSPDGLLLTKDGRRGIWECKTTTIMKSIDREKWWDREKKEKILPNNYYIQVLHGLNVTGFDFIELYAELTYPSGNSELVPYHIERDEVQDDLEVIRDGILEFWQYVRDDREPALILPGI